MLSGFPSPPLTPMASARAPSQDRLEPRSLGHHCFLTLPMMFPSVDTRQRFPSRHCTDRGEGTDQAHLQDRTF